MAQAALQARAAAAATVKESTRALERYRQGANPSSRLLQSKLDKLIADKDELVAKHYVYGDKSNKPYDSDEMEQWITPILDSVLDLTDAVFIKIDELQSAVVQQEVTREENALQTAKTNEMNIAEQQCKSNKRTVQERIVSMMEVVSDDSRETVNDANLIRTYLRQIEDAMSELIKSWNAYKSLSLTSEKLDAVFIEEEALRKHVSDSCLKATAQIIKIQPESVVSLTESTASSTGPGSVINENVVSAVKSEKIKKPNIQWRFTFLCSL